MHMQLHTEDVLDAIDLYVNITHTNTIQMLYTISTYGQALMSTYVCVGPPQNIETDIPLQIDIGMIHL